MSKLERTTWMICIIILLAANLIMYKDMRDQLKGQENQLSIIEQDIRQQESTITRLVIYILGKEKK